MNIYVYASTQKPDNKTRRDFEAITLSLTRHPAEGGNVVITENIKKNQ